MSTLSQFRPDAEATPTPGWRTPVSSDFVHGTIMGIDQSLGALGLVYLSNHQHDRLRVIDARTLSAEALADATGYEKALQQFADLRRQLVQEMRSLTFTSWTVTHEGIPSGNGRLRSVDSTLLAAAAVRAAADECGVVVGRMIQPQSWKRDLFGPEHAGASKAEIRHLIMRLAHNLGIKDLERVTNESQRDALGVAMSAMRRSR